MNTPFDANDRMLQKRLTDELPAPPDASFFQSALPTEAVKVRFTVRRKYIAVCCAVCMVLLSTALALYYSSFSKLLDEVQPAFTDYLVPVEMSYEQDGIRMEVVAVHAYQNDLMAYVTLQDLTGDRVNDRMVSHMDFFHVSGAHMYGMGAAHYDEENGIITYRITAQNQDGFEGKEVTISFRDIYNDEVSFTAYDTGFDLSALTGAAQTITVDDEELLNNIWRFHEAGGAYSDTILAPNSLAYAIPGVSTVQITGAGMIGGKLRLQIYRNYNENATTAYDFYLMDAQGSRLDGRQLFGYGCEADQGIVAWDSYYAEYEFDVDAVALAEYRLLADIRESTKYAGKWSVTVQTQESELASTYYPLDLDFGTFKLTGASVSHFGVDLIGEGVVYGDFDWWAFSPAAVVDGEQVELQFSSSSGSEEEKAEDNPALLFHCVSPVPLDPEKTTAIVLMGELVELASQPAT